MTRDDAEEAQKALGRAIDALSKDPPDVQTAKAEVVDAMQCMDKTYNPYADPKLRPGLKLQPVGSYAETQAAHEGKSNV